MKHTQRKKQKKTPTIIPTVNHELYLYKNQKLAALSLSVHVLCVHVWRV